MENFSKFFLDKILYWEYDDGSVQSVLMRYNIVTSYQVSTTKFFSNRGSWDDYKTKVQEGRPNTRGRKEVVFDRVKLTSGVQSMTKYQFSSDNEYVAAFEELKKLLRSCGDDAQAVRAVLILFSSILAGYLAQFIWKGAQGNKSPLDLIGRAPLLAVSDFQGFEILKCLLDTLAVDTSSASDKKIAFHQPSILPPNKSYKKIANCAGIEFQSKDDVLDLNQGKPPYPAQYRDTAVLVETKYFSTPKELKTFQLRNPWVTTILYAPTPRMFTTEPIAVNLKSLETCALDSWNREQVYNLMIDFTVWAGKKNNRESLYDWTIQAANAIAAYNKQRNRKSIVGNTKDWLIMQLVALRCFLQFCKRKACFLKQERKQINALWQNLLLPGSVPVPEEIHSSVLSAPSNTADPIKVDATEGIISLEKDSRRVFEETIIKVLVEGLPEHIPVYISKSPEPSEDVWGCLRWHRNQQDQSQFKALVFPTAELNRLSKEFCSRTSRWDQILSSVRKKSPPYLYPVKNCRMYGRSKPVNAVTIQLDKASFLPQDIKKQIKELFTLAQEKS